MCQNNVLKQCANTMCQNNVPKQCAKTMCQNKNDEYDFLKAFFLISDSQMLLFLCPGGLNKKFDWNSDLWIVPTDFKKKI